MYGSISNAQSPQWCAVDYNIISKSHKSSSLFQKVKDYTPAIKSRSIKWIPVVVHVVTADPQLITYGRIIQQIKVLNNDFAKRGENIALLSEEFSTLAADTEIRFCLATVDPLGNTTSGITYTQTSVNNIALERDDNGRYVVYYDQLGGKSAWDISRYINIWVAEFGNGVLGYGSLPGTAPFPEENGIVMDPLFFGAYGLTHTSGYFNKGHTLTHEMGHFLGLSHISGEDNNSCTDSDEIEDTPNAAGPYFGCPTGRQESCGVSNMYQNFMDLTDDRCLAAFTHGQAMRMNAVLDLFYPQLINQTACKNNTVVFGDWYRNLTWGYAQQAGQYLFYSDQIFSGEILIDVFTLNGKQIFHNKYDDVSTYLIDLDNLPPGIYLVRITSGKEFETKKVVVY